MNILMAITGGMMILIFFIALFERMRNDGIDIKPILKGTFISLLTVAWLVGGIYLLGIGIGAK